MWCKTRHKIITEFLRPFFWVYYALRFRCPVKKQKLPAEGAVVIANHVTTLDPVLIGLLFNRPLYYMTSKHIFQNKRLGKLLRFLVNPIAKEKINKSDIAAIKACMQVARENGSICIFPEGNRTFSGKVGYVDPAITKLVKRLGKPLIICNILGGYGVDPRWCNGSRRGKLSVFVKHIYTPEDMKAMTNEELYSTVMSDITVDEFADGAVYRSARRAECLESVAFICPVCQQKHTIHSKKHTVSCSACGMQATYNEDQTLSSEDGRFPFTYVHQWYDYQLKLLKETEFADEEKIYSDSAEVYKPELGQKKQLIGSGDVVLYGGAMCFALDSGEIRLPIEQIDGITLIGNHIMDVYSNEQTYRVFVAHNTNILKYLHTYYIIRNRKLGIEDGFVGI